MKIKIDVDYIYSRIVGSYPKKQLRQLLAFHPPGYRFHPKYQEKLWDGYIKLLGTDNIFPTGLIPRVQEYCRRAKIEIIFEVLYEKSVSPDPVETIGPFTLRDYQMSAQSIFLKKKRGIIKAGTGGGKTLISAAIAKALDCPTIFLVHTKDLLYQTHGVYEECFDEIGIVGDGKCDMKKITICSIPTLVRNPDKFSEWLTTHKLVIGDEVHHATSQTWYELFTYIPAEYRLGLSATPGIGDNKLQLEAVTGPIISNISAKKLIKGGYLAKPVVTFVKYDSESLDDRTGYQAAYKSGLSECVERNDTIIDIAKVADYPCLIMVKTLKHMNVLCEYLKGEGSIKFGAVHGKNSAKFRKKKMDELEGGEIDVLVCTTIFDEGVDLPAVASTILAGGGFSRKKTVQRVGRVLRPAEGKDRAYIYDLEDVNHKHLSKHTQIRKSTLMNEGHDVRTIHIKELIDE